MGMSLIKRSARFIVVVYSTVLMAIFFQNCSKVRFSQELAQNLDVNTQALAPISYEPPVTPAGPAHGDIVGALKPFSVAAQKVVPKTKMVIVVDNSGSMQNSQKNLASGLDNMLSSLELQIRDGLNPDVEFYIVTTTNYGSPASFNYLYDPKTQNIDFRFYNKYALSTIDGEVLCADATGLVAACSAFGSTIPRTGYSVNKFFLQSSSLSKFIVREPGLSAKEYSLEQLKQLIKSGEIITGYQLSPSSNDYNYAVKYFSSDSYLKYRQYIGFNDGQDLFGNTPNPPAYLLKDGSPLKYSAIFDLNTTYPQTAPFSNGATVPYKKIVLNSEKYLVSTTSATREFDSDKFTNFRSELKNAITSIGTNGSNEEMGLCALHRTLSMTGENQIFQKNDRAAFLIISDEQDAQTKWENCPIQSEIGTDKENLNEINFTCKSGDKCVFPEKVADYLGKINFNQKTPPNLGNKRTIASTAGSYTKVVQYQNYVTTGTGKYYWSNIYYQFAEDFTYRVNTEGQVTSIKNDGQNGRPKIFDYRNQNLFFSEAAFFYVSNYTTQKSFTLAEYNSRPVDQRTTCRDEDRAALLSGFMANNAKFKAFYLSLSPEDQSLALICKTVQVAEEVKGEWKYTPTIREIDFNISYGQFDSYSRVVTNDKCIEISQNNQCDADSIIRLKAATCSVVGSFGSPDYDCASSIEFTSCTERCAPGAEKITPYSFYLEIKSSDPDFIANFKSGYNKPFQARINDGATATKSFSSYSSYDQLVNLNPQDYGASGSTFVDVSVSGLQAYPNPNGTHKESKVVSYLPYTKIVSIADKIINEGISIVAAVFNNTSAVTRSESTAKIKEQIITGFHQRAKKLFNNNYFVSSIVIPSGAGYPNNHCPGVNEEESQSEGLEYIRLLDDAYYAKKIIIDGTELTQIDTHRKAFADICKGDFAPALEPLKNFISNVAINRYKLEIPANREIHSISLKSSQNSTEKILSMEEWSFDGDTLSLDPGVIQIGDEVSVKLTIATQ